MLEGNVWMERYGDLTDAAKKYKTSKKKDKILELNLVLTKMKELLAVKKLSSMSISTYTECNLKEVKEIIDEYKEAKITNKKIAGAVGEIYYYYAILHENIHRPNQILPLLLEVEKFLEKIHSKEKILIYVLPKTLLQIAQNYGRNEEIDAKKYYDKANDFFNKVEGSKETILEEKIKFYVSYGISKIQQGETEIAITIFEKMEGSIKEFEKVAGSENDFLNVAYLSAARMMTAIMEYNKAEKYYKKVLIYIDSLIDSYLPKERAIDMSMLMGSPSMSYNPMEIGTKQLAMKEQRMVEQFIQRELQRIEADPRCKYIRINLEFASSLMANNRNRDAENVIMQVVEKYDDVFKKYGFFKPTLALYLVTLGLIESEHKNREKALYFMEQGWKFFKESRHYNSNQIEFLTKLVPLVYLLLDERKEKQAEDILYEIIGFIDYIKKPESEIEAKYLEFIAYICLLDIHLKTNRIEDGFNIMTNCFNKIKELIENYPPALISAKSMHLENFFILAKKMCKKKTDSEICKSILQYKETILEKLN